MRHSARLSTLPKNFFFVRVSSRDRGFGTGHCGRARSIAGQSAASTPRENARARDAFVARFSQGGLPEDLEEVTLTAESGTLGIAHVLKGAGLVPSTSEAFRQLKQGAVKVDGARIEDGTLSFAAGSTHVFQVGKRRLARVTLR